MNNVFTSLSKNVFKSSTVSNRSSYSNENIGSGMTTLITSNKKMKDIIEVVKYPEESSLLNKGVKNLK